HTIRICLAISLDISFINAMTITVIYSLSLHDALPILDYPPLGKISYALIFPIGLAMIIYLNGELATSNMMYLFAGAHRRKLSWSDRKSTRLNSSHVSISYAVFSLKKKKYRRCLLILID